MNGVEPRRQTAKVAKPRDEKTTTGDVDGKANGYVNNKTPKRADSSENIFLFYPNIIGVFQVLLFLLDVVSDHTRVLTHHPCHCIAVLHAPPPKNMLPPVQRLMPAGCPRRRGCSVLSTVHSLRCRARHGYGSLHNRLLVSISELRLASMGTFVSRTDQFGLGEPLHAHVCNTDHGRIGAKSQEGGSEQEQDFTSLLQQQGR